MRRNRRKFLKSLALGGTVGAGTLTYWLAASEQRAARVLRRIVQDATRRVAPSPVKPDLAGWSDNQIGLCWIGHSTVLINFFGIRILTDPVLGNNVGVSLGPLGTAGIKRYFGPALSFEELGSIDLLLLSHAHMDHMDLPTLRRFPAELATISAPDTSDLLAKGGRTRFEQIRWGERTVVRTSVGALEVEAFEVKHWGQRWPSELRRGYNGYILRREGRSLIFGGDTAQTSTFAALRSRGPFVAALMPIGAYRPWISNHCTPEEAFQMADQAGASYILPVHHQTFRLSEEPRNEPIERMEFALRHEPDRLIGRRPGDSFLIKG